MLSYLTKRVEQAREEKANLLILQINSPGGNDTVTDRLADLVAGIKDMKTVAYIEDRAVGLAALLPLACRDIVFKKGSRMGDVRQVIAGRNGPLHDLSEGQIAGLAGKAELWARLQGPSRGRRPGDGRSRAPRSSRPSIPRPGPRRLILKTDLAADPGRYQVIRTRKDPGSVLTVEADEAESYGRLGRVVNDAEELKALYGLHGRDIRIEGPGWVDSFVDFLTEPVVSWLLLFLGVFMMVVELKLPGIGLPGIISALAFLLFFWSHYLSGTADQLEIILFLIGLVCLAVELFVFPGMAIFGHERDPADALQHRDGQPYLHLADAGLRIPRAGLHPAPGHRDADRRGGRGGDPGALYPLAAAVQPADPQAGALDSPEARRGRGPAGRGRVRVAQLPRSARPGVSTTPLRPTGKARFGNLQIDVMASGSFVEPDTLVEVVDVQGARVIVKKV